MKRILSISAIVILGLTLSIGAYMLFSESAKLQAFKKELQQVETINMKYGELSTEFTTSYKKQNELRTSLQPAIEKNENALKQIVQTIEEQQKINELQQAEITKSNSIIPELKKELTNLSPESQASATQMLTLLEQTNNQKQLIYDQNKIILEQEHMYFLQLSQGKLDAKEVNSNEYQKLNQLIDQLNKQLNDYQNAYKEFFAQAQ